MANTPSMPVRQATLTAGEAITAKGQLIAVDTSSGAAYAATDSATRRVVGVNSETAASGAKIVAVSGIFGFANANSTDVAKTDIGTLCYVHDSVTVSMTSNDAKVGTVVDVDSVSGLVYVNVGASTIF